MLPFFYKKKEELQRAPTMGNETPDPEHLQVLESRFGHSSFRPMQWRIIRSIIEDKRDNCVIMATGYGKSLTYQFPSVFLNRLTLVISPLISLMEDQVLSLNLFNIPACLLGTAQQANPLPDIRAGAFRIVYLTPEYVTGDAGRALLEAVNEQLVLIAIDEAHCLSKWGHDFRPAYRNLGVVRKLCPRVPILAVTATATPNVREDIVQCLSLRQPQTLCTGFDRPNLEFIVRMKGNHGVLDDIGRLLSTTREGSIIIYCLTRKQTEEIVELLRSRRIDCEAYHAGLSLKLRKAVHERFVRDNVQIIVATIAFGMGIDKPDVRLVIHYGASKDLESYYQEAGRAGRDGQPSRCIMFWGRQDFKTHEILRDFSQGEVQKNLEALSKKMHEYLDTRDCRRQFILRYFEGKTGEVSSRDASKAEMKKNCCDNCTRGGSAKDAEKYQGIDAEGRYDFAKDAEQLMKAIDVFGGGTGLALPIYLLRGSKNKKLNDSHCRHPLHGVGKARDEDWWKSIGTLLERESLLRKVKIPNTFNKFATIYKVQITPTGRKWLESVAPERKLLLKPTADMFKSLKVIQPLSLYESYNSGTEASSPGNAKSARNLLLPAASEKSKQDVVQELVKVLLKKRTELATSFECMPYMIASNVALHQMATRRPLNLDEMKAAKLDGFSDIKLQKFGREFLTCIQQTLRFLPPDLPAGLSSATQQQTWNYWRTEGLSVQQIATKRQLAPSTIVQHLCEAIRQGLPFEFKTDLGRLGVSSTVYRTIQALLPAASKAIKEQLPADEVTYEQINIVRACEQARQKRAIPLDEVLGSGAQQTTSKQQHPRVEESRAVHERITDNDNAPEDVWNSSDLMDEEDFDMGEIDKLEQDVASGSGSQPLNTSLEQTAEEATNKEEKPKGTFVMKTPSRGAAAAKMKRILYEDSEGDGEEDFQLPKRRL